MVQTVPPRGLAAARLHHDPRVSAVLERYPLGIVQRTWGAEGAN